MKISITKPDPKGVRLQDAKPGKLYVIDGLPAHRLYLVVRKHGGADENVMIMLGKDSGHYCVGSHGGCLIEVGELEVEA